MIPTITHLETSRSQLNQDSYVTGSVTAAAGSIVIVDVRSQVSTGPINTPTISGMSLTWTQVATQNRTTDTWQQTRFRALVGGSPASGAITIDYASQFQQNCEWSINQITDCLTTGTNGADAIAQTKTGASPGVGSSYSLTFDATWDHADNIALGAFAHNSDVRVFVAGTNFTILGQVIGSSSNAGLATEYGRDSDDVVDISTAAGNHAWTAIISEIVGASEAAPPPDPDTVLLTRVRRRGFNHWAN